MKLTKKILISLSIVTLLAATTFAATKAYFTDTAYASNDLQAGKLDVKLNGADAAGVKIELDTTQTFKGGLVPGKWVGPYYIDVYNQGWGVSTIPVKYQWTSSFVSGEGALYDKLNVDARHSFCGTGVFAPATSKYVGLVKDMNLNSVDHAIADFIDPNISHCWQFYFQLDPTADNSYQGDATQFDLYLDATHEENPGWTQ